MAALEHFSPPLVSEASRFEDLRTRIIAERHNASAAQIADVTARWRALSASWRPLGEAVEQLRPQQATIVQLKLL
jgi:hypothetical protein